MSATVIQLSGSSTEQLNHLIETQLSQQSFIKTGYADFWETFQDTGESRECIKVNTFKH